jgi:hypothetical protein
VTRPGIDPGTVRLVAQRLNHYATTGPHSTVTSSVKHLSLILTPLFLLLSLLTHLPRRSAMNVLWNQHEQY